MSSRRSYRTVSPDHYSPANIPDMPSGDTAGPAGTIETAGVPDGEGPKPWRGRLPGSGAMVPRTGEEPAMSSLLIGSSAWEARTPKAGAPSRWARLARAIVDEWRVRRAKAEMHALDGPVLRDMGLGRCGIEHAVRFGRD